MEAITGAKGNVIRPRALKNKETQGTRTRNMAEVFTPLWICNKQNNLADTAWLGKEAAFNIEAGNKWHACKEKILFPKAKGVKCWHDYLASKRLEITCGEAPYLASRYDTLTGEIIPLEERIGLLDRKLRIINERTRNFKDRKRAQRRWLELAKLAMQSIYGYEWAGDNVLLARENLLYTLIDYYAAKFNDQMDMEALEMFAEIISWNIWQMDGLKAVVPLSCHDYKKERQAVSPNLFLARDFSARALKRSMSFCDVDEQELQKCQGCLKDNIDLHNGVYCKFKNWSTGKVLLFKDLLDDEGSEGKMAKDFKFDVVIGNPPYQENSNNTSDRPVYDKFMSASYKVGDLVELITPARFLFNAGKTPKEWNKQMLEDEHLKVVYYEPDSKKVFPPPSDIKGGIAITMRDRLHKCGCIGTFTKYPKLNKILHKVIAVEIEKNKEFIGLDTFVYAPESYKFTRVLHEEHPEIENLMSQGHSNDLTSNVFDRLCGTNIFVDNCDGENEYVKIFGLENKKRKWKYIKKEYIKEHENIHKYKIFLPKSNGSGTFGETMAANVFGDVETGHTQTFISIGKFNSAIEAKNLGLFLKTKFSRTMLGILKVTQDNKKTVWSYVPLQNFTTSSDIDWSKSIHEIDLQLYKKYNLNAEEIDFIEKNVKEME